MTPEELDALWARYKDFADADDLERLVRQYAPLARYLARRALAKAPPYQDAEDILSYAHHGLLDAIARFEPGRVKFETYATRRISGAIVDGQRQQDPLARGARRKVKALEAASVQLWEELSRDPSVEELAARLGESAASVRATLLAQKSLAGSLDAHATESRGVESDAEVGALVAEVRSRLAQRLAQLSSRERAFVLAYYCTDRNLRATSEVLGMSNDWCRQTRSQVLSSLGA